MSSSEFSHALVLGVMLACVSGCGEADSREVYEVEGHLFVGDRPAANASLAFHPLEISASRSCPVALTRADGSYRLTTYQWGDGAPAGEYVVTVIWPDETKPVDECECPRPDEHDKLRGLYADQNVSTLRAIVRPGKNIIPMHVEDVEARLKEWAAQPRQ